MNFSRTVGNLQNTNPFALKSVNGGTTRAFLNAQNLTPNPASISCVNRNVCVVAGSGTFNTNRSISRTTNGELSWQSEYVPSQRMGHLVFTPSVYSLLSETRSDDTTYSTNVSSQCLWRRALMRRSGSQTRRPGYCQMELTQRSSKFVDSKLHCPGRSEFNVDEL
jgi:hypothetical protein